MHPSGTRWGNGRGRAQLKCHHPLTECSLHLQCENLGKQKLLQRETHLGLQPQTRERCLTQHVYMPQGTFGPTHADNSRTMVRCVHTIHWRTVADQVCSWYSRQAYRARTADGMCVCTRQVQGDVPPEARPSNSNNASLTHFVRRRPSDRQGEQNQTACSHQRLLAQTLSTLMQLFVLSTTFHMNMSVERAPVGSGITRSDGGGAQSHVSRTSAPELVPSGRLFAPLIQRLSPGEHRDMVSPVKAVRHLHFGDTRPHLDVSMDPKHVGAVV